MKQRALLFGIWLLVLLLLLPAMLRMLYCVLAVPDKAFTQAKGFDRLGSALTNGSDNEYISTRAYEATQKKKTWGCVLCKLLDLLEKDHCQKSFDGQYNTAPKQ